MDTPAGIPTREVDGKELETVSVSASRKDGRLLVSLSNLDADAAQDVEIDLRGGGLGDFEALILNADTLQSHNTPEALEAVAPQKHDGVKVEGSKLRVHLPAHSFVTVSGALA